MPPAPSCALLLALLVGLAGCRSSPGGGARGFVVTETDDALRVSHDGATFSEYRFRDVTRPFLYPLHGPDGVHMTRRWPQEEVGGEEKDHPHHHAFWWAHGEADGEDFWSEAPKAGRTVHQYFTERRGGRDRAVIAARNRWIAKDGRVVAEDERRMTFHAPRADLRVVDFEITIHALATNLVLGDTKEGSFAIRLAESMRLRREDKSRGDGRIVNARGERDDAAWGKRAEWCDYSGPVAGRTYGVAILDHPSNPRYPTWWHVRDYGLFAANPFGVHDFEKRSKGTGDLVVPPGNPVTFRYRVLLHRGDAASARVEAHHAAFVAGKEKP